MKQRLLPSRFSFLAFLAFLPSLLTPLTISLALFSCASVPVSSDSKDQQTFVLGSLHSVMLNKPGYSLNEFLAAIDSFRPDVILTEVRTDRPGAMEGSIDGGIEQSLIYAYGNVANVPIIPADSGDVNSLNSGTSPNAKQSALLQKKVAPLVANYRKSVQTDDFFKLHEAAVQTNIQKMYETYEQGGVSASRIRNEKTCANIKSTLAISKSKRVLVIFGIERKYALDACLKSLGVELVSASDFVDRKKLAAFVAPETLKTQAIANMKASRLFLEQNRAKGMYQGALKKQMESKLESYPKWIEAVSNLP